MMGSRKGLTGSDTQACKGMVLTGSLIPAIRATSELIPATACNTLSQAISPRRVFTPVTFPFSIFSPRHFCLCMDFHAERRRPPGISPGHRIVAGDGAGGDDTRRRVWGSARQG